MKTKTSNKLDFSILDSLRGFASLSVTIGHCRALLFIGILEYSTMYPRQAWSVFDYLKMASLYLTRYGGEFVIFFFVLSGFSIAYSLRNKPPLKGFYFRRLVRLYPPYILALVWAIAVHLLLVLFIPDVFKDQKSGYLLKRLYGSDNFLNVKIVVSNLLYITRGPLVGQFWSLTHEVIFYFLSPLLLLRFKMSVVISLVLYIIGWIVYGQLHAVENIVSAYFMGFNLYFIIGILALKNWDTVCKWVHMKKVVLCLSLLGLLGLIIFLRYKYSEITRLSALITSIITIICVVNFHTHKIKIKLLSWIGKFSYSLYATHIASIYLFYIIIQLILNGNFPFKSTYFWLLGIPFCCIIALIAYTLVEKKTKLYLDTLRK